MTKALLINPGMNLKKIKYPTYIFPFGLGYIASYAEKNGTEIDIWDIHASQIDFDKVKEIISQKDFSIYDIIGITGIVNQYSYIKELTKYLKKRTNIPIVVGGPLASYSWKLILENLDVDICVIGEGELTFLDLLNKKDLTSIDGIAYKTKDGIKKNNDRELIKNIDEIGYPAFHLFDLNFYMSHSEMMHPIRPFYRGKRILSIITSRGCPYNCRFCSKSMKGIRMKSLDFLFKEIEFYKNNLKVEGIHIVDELVILNKKRFLEFCNRIKKYNLFWDCQGRINHVDEKVLRAMKNANGVCIGFGIESGSQKILDAMDKRIKAKDIIIILKICQRINLPVKLQLIFGYPGENWQTLKETLSVFRKVRLPGRGLNPITPLPGSILYEEAKNDGFIGINKSDKISEVKYLEFLSDNSGLVSNKLFYNRTSFTDDKFFKIKNKIEKNLFYNFYKIMIMHPFFINKNWEFYKFYILAWSSSFHYPLLFLKFSIYLPMTIMRYLKRK